MNFAGVVVENPFAARGPARSGSVIACPNDRSPTLSIAPVDK